MNIDTEAFAEARERLGDEAFEALPLRSQLAACDQGIADAIAEANEHIVKVDIAAEPTAPTERPVSPIWALPNGIHLDVPAEVYHHRELGGPVNNTALKEVHQSPAHYKAWAEGERTMADTKALRFGRAFHCAVLEPYVFATTYAIRPEFPEPERPRGDDGKPLNFRLKVNAAAKAAHAAAVAAVKEAEDAWDEEHANHIVLSAEDAATIVKMTAAVMAYPEAKELLQGGVAEATLRWDDPVTGLPCKCRDDYYREDLETCVDLKTTQSAKDDEFGRSAGKFRYHVQAAHYAAGHAEVGKPIQNFVFIAVEKEPPYAVSMFYLDRDSAESGESTYRADMQRLAECLESGEFPGYGTGIRPLRLPHYML